MLLKSSQAYTVSAYYGPKAYELLMAKKFFGLTWLKVPQVAMHCYVTEESYKDPLEKYQKEYIEHSPDIHVVDLTENDRWLILATDGLWKHLSREEVSHVVSQIDLKEQNAPDTTHVVKQLLESALDKICDKKGVTKQFMAELEPGM